MKGVIIMTYLNLVRPKTLVEELFDSWPFYSEAPVRSARPSFLGDEWIENDKEVRIKVELPGVDKSDVHVTYKDDILTIKAEKKENDYSESDIRYTGIKYGAFEKHYRLKDINFDNAKGKMDHGILEISFPKVPEKQSKRLSLK